MTKKPKTKVKAKKTSARYDFSYTKPVELRRFLNDQGMLISRFETGITQKQQRKLAKEVKRARFLGLLPFTQTIY